MKVAPFEPAPALLAKIRHVWKGLPRTDARMKQLALKNVNNGLNTNTKSYLETLGGQSTNLYLNVFLTLVLIIHQWQLKTAVFLHWCLIHALLMTWCLCLWQRKKMFYEIFSWLQTFHFRQKKIRGEENFVLIFAFSSLACWDKTLPLLWRNLKFPIFSNINQKQRTCTTNLFLLVYIS